jgi:tripartite-type tricarboxylate transporter receptor subunit TctC
MKFFGSVVLAALLFTGASLAHCQTYPSKPVRLIIPFAPGGGADFFGRKLAERLSARLGQPFVVDNRGGAGGAVGTEIAARSAPDGYTLVFVSNGFPVSPAVSKVAYDPVQDFSPIARVVDTSMVVAINPSLPVSTLQELVTYAKAKPKEISYGSSGVGGIAHLATEEFLWQTGTKMTHIPYKGTGPANTALLAGEIQVNIGDVGAVSSLASAGRVKLIAVGGAKRVKAMPNVPTAAESGYPDAKLDIWYGLLAPKGTPAAVIAKLNAEVNAILKEPEMVEAFAARFASPGGGSPQDFANDINKDYTNWKRFADQTGIKVE